MQKARQICFCGDQVGCEQQVSLNLKEGKDFGCERKKRKDKRKKATVRNCFSFFFFSSSFPSVMSTYHPSYARLVSLLQSLSCPLARHMSRELLLDHTNVFRLNLLEWLVFSYDPFLIDTRDAVIPDTHTRITSQIFLHFFSFLFFSFSF